MRKIDRAGSVDGTKTHACNFVSNACFYGEPVQSVEMRGDVVSTRNPQDQACCSVLQFLKSLYKILWAIYKETIAIVQMGEHKCRNKGFCCLG